MCGIAGILTKHRGDLDSPLTRMREALKHRGPDDEGQEVVELSHGWRLGLAHTRLSIQDLSSAGRQPMIEPATGSRVAFNGEIYNHQSLRSSLPPREYRSTGDTETLLHGWIQEGGSFLRQMRGMFAFALWDAKRSEFWLVRDRLGIKPLYVAKVRPGEWAFASEVRALLASGLVSRRLHEAALQSYLAFGAVAAPWTLVEGVESLLPAEAWRFTIPSNDEEWPQKSTYWAPAFCQTGGPAIRREEAIEEIRPVLSEATKLRMVADVPVGVFLSGGIDSSAIVASLVGNGVKPHTLSVSFDESEFDESEHSRTIARQFGTEHTELRLRADAMLTGLDAAVEAYDLPSIDGINTYFISQATRSAGLKVALSGIGGDELFAGYPYFRAVRLVDRPWLRAGASIAVGVGRILRPRNVRLQKLAGLLRAAGPLERYASCRKVMSLETRNRIRAPSALGNAVPLDCHLAQCLRRETAELDAVNAHSRLELALYLANMLLRDTDQMSMAHALEVREPLLDHVLVETAARFSGSLKLAPGRSSHTKALLADSLSAPLPSSVVSRKKMGFVFPWERWLRGPLSDKVDCSFKNHRAIEGLGLRGDALREVWSEYRSGAANVRYTDILALRHLIEWTSRHIFQ